MSLPTPHLVVPPHNNTIGIWVIASAESRREEFDDDEDVDKEHGLGLHVSRELEPPSFYFH